MLYLLFMLKSFKCKETEKLWKQENNKIPSTIKAVALRKLAQIHYSSDLDDLKVPPANHLESLKGKRKGQHSIRINKQYRICFKWHQGYASKVEIIDYH